MRRLLTLFALAAVLFAQTSTSTLDGLVKDPQGAAFYIIQPEPPDQPADPPGLEEPLFGRVHGLCLIPHLLASVHVRSSLCSGPVPVAV